MILAPRQSEWKQVFLISSKLIRLCSHLKVVLGKNPLQVHSIGKIHFLMVGPFPNGARAHLPTGYWLEAILSFIWLLRMAASFIKASKRGSSSKMNVTILCQLITEVTFCHFCYSVFAREGIRYWDHLEPSWHLVTI